MILRCAKFYDRLPVPPRFRMLLPAAALLYRVPSPAILGGGHEMLERLAHGHVSGGHFSSLFRKMHICTALCFSSRLRGIFPPHARDQRGAQGLLNCGGRTVRNRSFPLSVEFPCEQAWRASWPADFATHNRHHPHYRDDRVVLPSSVRFSCSRNCARDGRTTGEPDPFMILAPAEISGEVNPAAVPENSSGEERSATGLPLTG